MVKALIFMALMIGSAVEFFVYRQIGFSIVSTIYVILNMQADYAAYRLSRDGLWPTGIVMAPSMGDPVIDLPPLGKKKRDEPVFANYELPHQPRASEGKGKEGAKEEARRAHQQQQARPGPARPQAQAARPPADSRPRDAAAAKPAEQPKPNQPRHPNFRGTPNEVLGVPTQAATQTIVHAFRYWMKRYHPDRGRTEAERHSAHDKAIRLSSAKATLLARREQQRKKSAA